jgi:hypothetical protein
MVRASRGEICEGGRGELEKELVLGTTLRAMISIGTNFNYISLLEVQEIKKRSVWSGIVGNWEVSVLRKLIEARFSEVAVGRASPHLNHHAILAKSGTIDLFGKTHDLQSFSFSFIDFII